MSRTGLRIIHAVRSDGFAGVERYVSNLAAGQVARGHSVSVIGGDPLRMRGVWQATDVEFWPATTVADVARQLTRYRRPDVVHAHMTAAELAAVVTKPLVRAPIVVTRHFARTRGSSAPSRAIGRALGKVVTGQISISKYVAAHIDGPSVVVHLGCPTPATVTSNQDRPLTVLVAQRFEPEKRTDLALRVWAESGLAGRGWRLQLAGDGAQRGELEALAGKLRIHASCEFLGFRNDVIDLLAEASAFLAPCPVEGFGLSVVEAMACGTPVVAAREGAHAETVGASRLARLYGSTDVATGARMLAELGENPADRSSYGIDLRRVQADLFSIDRMVEGTVEAYRGFIR